MYYSVFENSIIMEDFFKEAGLMCDSTGDACWQLSVRAFSWSTHQNAYMHHKFASVCVSERA